MLITRTLLLVGYVPGMLIFTIGRILIEIWRGSRVVAHDVAFIHRDWCRTWRGPGPSWRVRRG